MPPAIHQLLAGFSNGDAISNEARVLRGIFRRWGRASEIFCEHRRVLPELRADCRDLQAARAAVAPDDIVILHLSIGSDANLLFPDLRGRKVIIYHNITPPAFFRAVNEATAGHLERGRQQMALLAGAAEINLADSGFNAREIEALGYRDVRVLPITMDFAHLRQPPHRGILSRYQDGLTNLLFVGRCVPNKRIEDLLHAFHYYQRYVNPESRLIHVGSFAGTEPYQAMLETLKKDLHLENVDFLGSIPDDQLRACYQASHVFLCMSEHEGFCIPVLEAMAADVPVLAFAEAAVPETMAGAGVLFHRKRFDEVAEMLHRLAASGPLRDAVLAGQRERIRRFEARDLDAELRGLLAPVL